MKNLALLSTNNEVVSPFDLQVCHALQLLFLDVRPTISKLFAFLVFSWYDIFDLLRHYAAFLFELYFEVAKKVGLQGCFSQLFK